jgi:hypothetical protein
MLLRILVALIIFVTFYSNTRACGLRKVLYIDSAGNKRIVDEPMMIKGEYLRTCGGSKVAYIDPVTGEKIIVDAIVREDLQNEARRPPTPNN